MNGRTGRSLEVAGPVPLSRGPDVARLSRIIAKVDPPPFHRSKKLQSTNRFCMEASIFSRDLLSCEPLHGISGYFPVRPRAQYNESQRPSSHTFFMRPMRLFVLAPQIRRRCGDVA